MAAVEEQNLAANLDTARHLAISGAIKTVGIAWSGNGWAMVISTNSNARYLVVTDRKKIRFFKTLESAARFAKMFFQNDIWVNMSKWDPNQQEIKA